MKENKGRRAFLKECTIDLLFEQGFNAMSIKDICSMAGINRAMVSYYYHSKLGLFKEIVDDSQKELENAFLFNPKTGLQTFEHMVEDAVKIIGRFHKPLFICSSEVSVIRKFLYPAYRVSKLYAPVINYFNAYLDCHYHSIFNSKESRKQLFLRFLNRVLFFFMLNRSFDEENQHIVLKEEIMILKQYFLPENTCLSE